MTDDELRARSAALMQRLQDAVAADKNKIVELKASIESLEIDKREKVYNEIDRLQKEVLDIYDKTLNDILPDAFAVVKSTARRFAQNETITVTATQMDRDLAADARFDFVEIDGDKAIYHNSWTAGGNEVIWDMYTTMFSSSVVWFFMVLLRMTRSNADQSQRWLLVRVRPLWQLSLYSSMP